MTGRIERFDAPLSGVDLVGGALGGLLRRRGGPPVLPDRTLRREAVVEAGPVAAYARLCGFSPEQGVPITWPHILAFPLQMRMMLGRDFPYPALGLVHLGNRVRQHGRLSVADRLVLTVRAGALLAHDKGQAFTLETQATRDGAPVWDGVSTYLRLGRPGRGEPSTEPATGGETGAHVETWTVPSDLGRRYARVSGDANPIHTSILGARVFGFRGPIAHGMWTKARAIAALAPAEPLAAAEVEVAFRAPLFLPGQVELHATPAPGQRHDQTRTFEVCDAAGGRAHLRGRLTVRPAPTTLPEEPSC